MLSQAEIDAKANALLSHVGPDRESRVRAILTTIACLVAALGVKAGKPPSLLPVVLNFAQEDREWFGDLIDRIYSLFTSSPPAEIEEAILVYGEMLARLHIHLALTPMPVKES
jgi:hypothetical protein